MTLKCPSCYRRSFHDPSFLRVVSEDGNIFLCPLCDAEFVVTNIPAMPAVFVTEVAA